MLNALIFMNKLGVKLEIACTIKLKTCLQILQQKGLTRRVDNETSWISYNKKTGN